MTMSLEEQLREDQTNRDQALALVKTDIEHLKTDYANKGVSERAKDRLSDSANDIYEEAAEVASANRGIIAAIVAALVVWMMRNPILSMFTSDDDDQLDDERHSRI